jgi:hypothetical protein
MIINFETYNEGSSFDTIVWKAFQKATKHFKELHEKVTEEHVVEFIVHFVLNNYGIDLSDTKHVYKHLKNYVHHKINSRNENLTFENEQPNLHWELCNWLSKFDTKIYSVNRNYYERGEKKGIALSFQERTPKSGIYGGPTRTTIFTIRISNVKDKQLRAKPIEKIKVNVDYGFDSSQMIDKILVESIKEFIVKTLEKYSYFNKKTPNWSNKQYVNYDFYVNISNVDNIMNDLNNDFQFYMDSKKYNL